MTAILRLGDLRAATARILDASERRLGKEVDLDSLPFGYRWELDLRQIFDVEHGPGEPALAALNEDLEEILGVLERPEKDASVWHDVSHLIGLLQTLAFLDLSEPIAP